MSSGRHRGAQCLWTPCADAPGLASSITHGRDDLPYRPCVGIMVLNRAGRCGSGAATTRPASRRGRAPGGRCRRAASTQSEDPAKAALRELEEETGIRSVEIIAESPGWYTYDLPAGAAAEGLGRALSRPEAEVVRGCASSASDDEIAARSGRDTSTSSMPGAGPASTSWSGLIVPFKRAVYEQVVRDFAALAKPPR